MVTQVYSCQHNDLTPVVLGLIPPSDAAFHVPILRLRSDLDSVASSGRQAPVPLHLENRRVSL
jgi:hypothetical protein